MCKIEFKGYWSIHLTYIISMTINFIVGGYLLWENYQKINLLKKQLTELYRNDSERIVEPDESFLFRWRKGKAYRWID